MGRAVPAAERRVWSRAVWSNGASGTCGDALCARFANRPPDALRRRRHLDVADAEFAERIDDRVDDDAERRRRAALAGRAHAERMRRATAPR